MKPVGSVDGSMRTKTRKRGGKRRGRQGARSVGRSEQGTRRIERLPRSSSRKTPKGPRGVACGESANAKRLPHPHRRTGIPKLDLSDIVVGMRVNGKTTRRGGVAGKRVGRLGRPRLVGAASQAVDGTVARIRTHAKQTVARTGGRTLERHHGLRTTLTRRRRPRARMKTQGGKRGGQPVGEASMVEVGVGTILTPRRPRTNITGGDGTGMRRGGRRRPVDQTGATSAGRADGTRCLETLPRRQGAAGGRS